MTVYEFYKFLDKIYPKELSCPWDNDGIMCSRDPDASVRKVLVSLDATERALKYASEGEFDLLLTHHPMIFRKLEAVTPATLGGNRAVAAFGGDISVISLHTRLDAGRGGVNDSLVEKLGYTSSETFGDDESPALGRIFELESPIGAEAFSFTVKEKLGAQSVRLTRMQSCQKDSCGRWCGRRLRPSRNSQRRRYALMRRMFLQCSTGCRRARLVRSRSGTLPHGISRMP